MDDSRIIAHISANHSIQSLKEHSDEVASLAESFSSEFGFGSFGRAIGVLHDRGKRTHAFQSYIKKVTGYDSEAVYNGEDKSHAYIGALLAKEQYGTLSRLMINQIAGHHSGMYDCDELDELMKRTIPEEVLFDMENGDVSTEILKTIDNPGDLHHIIRMLFSCLVDADYLDTEKFMNPESFALRGIHTTMGELAVLLDAKIKEFGKAPDTAVNSIRNVIQKECKKASGMPPGFFSLTVPTGGGKTISSLVWAVLHAMKNGKKRIIIAIPYTSIVVQTSSVLKRIFGPDNVLEHHSNTDIEQCKDDILRHKMKLATENWDYPIIVTTNVQLFESMFSNKPSTCRKLHNICNSVLILDEVQTLPIGFLQPIVDALKCYNSHFGLSVLFTTASQPVLTGIIEGCNPRASFSGIESVHEIIPKSLNLHNSLRRVRLEFHDDGNTYDEIAQKISQYDKVLCIVNSRRDAKELYERLPRNGTIHLSRMMCPSHIREKIDEIKSKLSTGGQTVRVVSTQLIEAGVDIDFPVVFRQESGLDSILQAAGRCNREGKLDICTTHVFSLSKEKQLLRGTILDGNNARKSLSANSDWFAPETMERYFNQFYCRAESFDKKQITSLIYNPNEMYFETTAKEFRLIDDTNVQVIVNWDESMELVHQLTKDGPSYEIMKKLGQYTVGIRDNDFKELFATGQVKELLDGIFVVENKKMYNPEIGLITDTHWLEEIYIL